MLYYNTSMQQEKQSSFQGLGLGFGAKVNI